VRAGSLKFHRPVLLTVRDGEAEGRTTGNVSKQSLL
jgi:hypothetical protein